MSTIVTIGVGATNVSGLTRQHAPLMAMAPLVMAVRPSRSASRPATTEPAIPATPIAPKATTPVSATVGGTPVNVIRDTT